MPRSLDQLRAELVRLEGMSYGAYKRLAGRWPGQDFELRIDHVQGDPFATPSRVRLRIPSSTHRLDRASYEGRVRHAATTDFILRAFADATQRSDRAGSGHSGRIIVDRGDDVILQRSGGGFDGDTLELRFRVGLPARGRRILGRAAAALLCDSLPQAVGAVRVDQLDLDALQGFIASVDRKSVV
jgi:predicted ABC-class ATPase